MDVIFKPNGVDLHAVLSTFEVVSETRYRKTIMTMDNRERVFGKYSKFVVNVSFWPMDDDQSTEVYMALRPATFPVEFTNPNTGVSGEMEMRVEGNISNVFGLRSINGKRYYKGGVIQLRQV